MQPSFVRTSLAAAVAALATAAPAAAQIRIPPVRLILGGGETVGYALGSLAPDTNRTYARHHDAAALQIGLETDAPVRGVDLRLNYQVSNPLLRLTDFRNETEQDVFRTGVGTLTLDAAIHLPRVLDATPYVLVGAGIRNYDFHQVYFHDSNQAADPKDETDLGVRWGAGFRWNVGRYDIFVEGSRFTSWFQNDPVGPALTRAVKDYTFTAGFRIPIHR
ncbi:MAG TPA: hypothetical protein VF771_13205 [Longimicrobiaceae bacterium]